MKNFAEPQVLEKIKHHLDLVYGDVSTVDDTGVLAAELIDIMRLADDVQAPPQHFNYWDQTDVTVITYGDTLVKNDEAPLQTLKHFLDNHCDGCVTGAHILPFFPYTSDDGFAVSDFYAVHPKNGNWKDIEAIAEDYRLMADLVINHGSSKSEWFENFKKGEGIGHDYFYTAPEDAAISNVVRPRTSPL